MKKTMAILMAAAMIFSLTTGSFAETEEKELIVKTVEVELELSSEQEFEVLFIGDEIELTAVTPKHGSSFQDSWTVMGPKGEVQSNGTTRATVEGVDAYVAKATFSAQGAGLYTIKYNITMQAGKSHVRFEGEAETDEIMVVSDEVAIGIFFLESSRAQVGKSDNVKVEGSLYFVSADGSMLLIKAKESYVINKSETVKTLSAEVDGVEYTIEVS